MKNRANERPASRLMLVMTLSQVVLTTMIAPQQHFIDGVERLFPANALHRPRLELDHGLLR